MVFDAGKKLHCEIYGRPVGVDSFIRVWSVQDARPKAALKAVLSEFSRPTAMKYRFVTVGGKKAIEVTYTSFETPGRAFAVKTPSGEVLVVNWEGHEEGRDRGLSAYNLARSSLTFP
jgi:hypothetical protein